jgi:hypothetical protein
MGLSASPIALSRYLMYMKGLATSAIRSPKAQSVAERPRWNVHANEVSTALWWKICGQSNLQAG